MPFNNLQPSFLRLRDHYAERRRPIVFWVGAGLSTDAGLPNWPSLRDKLIAEALETANTFEPKQAREAEANLERASAEDNLWQAFQIIKNTIKDSEFKESIRKIFSSSNDVSPPLSYQMLWGLNNIRGMISFNVDGFAHRAHRIMRPNEDALNFVGKEAKNYLSAISSGKPFIANLHGLKEHYASWVFTKDEISNLISDESYRQFINFIFTSMTVIFVGISADDLAAGGFLEQLTAIGLDAGPHFWITNRRDEATHNWSSKAGIQIVRYQPETDSKGKVNHSVVLSKIFSEIHHYVSVDGKPSPVIPNLESSISLPSTQELRQKDDDEIRIILTSEARNIIDRNDGSTDNDEYRDFLKQYSPNIHQCWHITPDEPYNFFFGYRIIERVSKSNFSNIWRMEDNKGNSYALKIIQIDNLHSGMQIDSFRRGVQSLKYLTKAEVPSSVNLIDAYEIPTSLIMSFVEGRNLSNVIKDKGYYFWKDGINLIINTCKNLEFAHNLPQGILHRDVRPSNIMAPNYDWPEFEAIDAGIDRHSTVLLNYDMSWHVNAKGQTIAGNLEDAGFYAPELISDSHGSLARRTTVDSYGVGMTLFYLFTKMAPPAGGSKSTDWEDLLVSKFRTDDRLIWRSAPQKLRRIIKDATTPFEYDRTTVSDIKHRLDALSNAVQGKFEFVTPDLWAEELLSRISAGDYESLDGENEFRKIVKQGRSISCKANFKTKSVELRFINTGTEATDRTRAVKSWGDKLKAASQILESGGWKIGEDTSNRNMQIVLSASINIEELRTNIGKIATNLDRGLNQIRLD